MNLWFRGRLCEVKGSVEPRDFSVGIMADYFFLEDVVPLDEGPSMVHEHEYIDDFPMFRSLTEKEFKDLEWHAATHEGLTTCRTDMVYSWHWREYDSLMVEEYRHSQMTTEVVWP